MKAQLVSLEFQQLQICDGVLSIDVLDADSHHHPGELKIRLSVVRFRP
jgi:hypothetical protein